MDQLLKFVTLTLFLQNAHLLACQTVPVNPTNESIGVEAISSKSIKITANNFTGVSRFESIYQQRRFNLTEQNPYELLNTSEVGSKLKFIVRSTGQGGMYSSQNLSIDAYTFPVNPTNESIGVEAISSKSIKITAKNFTGVSRFEIIYQQRRFSLTEQNPYQLLNTSEDGSMLKFIVTSTGQGGMHSLQNLSIDAYTCPPDPEKTNINIQALSSETLNITVKFTTGIMRYEIKYDSTHLGLNREYESGIIKTSSEGEKVHLLISTFNYRNESCKTNLELDSFTRPQAPLCNVSLNISETMLSIFFVGEVPKSIRRYRVMLEPQPKNYSVQDIFPNSTLNIGMLTPGYQYNLTWKSIGLGDLESTEMCSHVFYSRPQAPLCNVSLTISETLLSIFFVGEVPKSIRRYRVMLEPQPKNYSVQDIFPNSTLNIGMLTPGYQYDLTWKSIGLGDLESTEMCSHEFYSRPQAPLCNVSLNISDTMLSIFFVDEVPKSIRRYRVMLEPQPKHYSVQDIFPNSTLNIGLLTPGYQYNLTWKSIGLGALESTEICSHVFYSKPDQPQIIQKYVTTSAVILVWNVIGNASSFTVDFDCNCFSECTMTIPNAVNNTVTVPGANITGLSPGSECNISIIAHSGDWDSHSLNITKIRTKETAPGLVRNITVFTSSRNVTIEWERPKNPNGIIRNYTVTINTTEDKMMVNTSITDFPNASFRGLVPGTCYTISIAASTNVGCGNDSTADFYTDEEAPGKISHLMTTNMSSKSIQISWDQPLQPNGVITFYIIYIRKNMSNETECDQAIMLQCENCSHPCPEAISSTNQDSVEPLMKNCRSYRNKTFTSQTDKFNESFSGLAPYTAYEIEGYAGTRKGLGSSEKRNQNTSEDVPSPILNITLDPSIYDIKTTMDRPQFPNGVITRYEIECIPENRTKDCDKFNNTVKELFKPKAISITNQAELDRNTVSKDILGLLPYWLYTIRGRSYTSAGHSDWSEPKTVRTLPFHPDSVTNINIGDVTSNSISMSWSTPCFTNGIIKQYHVQTEGKKYSVKLTDGNNTMITINHLQPFQNYSFIIFAETLGETGGISSTGKSSYITQTLCTVPYPPRNATQVAKTANSISLQWLQPEKRTCLTNYTVTATDIRNKSLMFNCSTKGFNNNNCTVFKLDEYWEYEIKIRSITVNGSAETDVGLKIRTKEAAPGKVTSLKVVPERNVTLDRTMTVTWKEPLERDKNGIIRFYYIIYTDEKSDIHGTIRVDNTTFKKRISVNGGRNYLVKVLACTITNATLAANRTTFVRNGAPIFNFGGNEDTVKQFAIEETVQRSPDDDEKQFVVALPVAKLCDNRNGKIIERGIIVSDTKSISGNVKNFFGERSLYESMKNKNYKTWQEVHEMDNMSPYIATTKLDKLCSKAKRSKRDATETTSTITNVLIGEERDCKGTTEKYCNGYLNPGKEYKVRMYLCTDAGCTETPYFGPFKTEPNNVPLIAGSVSGVLAGIIAVISIVMIIWWRRRRMKKKTEGSSGEDNFAFDGEAMKHLNKTSKTNIHKAAFARHVEEMHADSNLNFAKEYKNIKDNSPSHCTNAAEQQSTRMKNRYTNILAYDHSRVKLLPTEDEEGSDYINANYIPGFNSPREYIATQGPQTCTKDDFWRMIWEQNVSVIVMLTQLVERGRRKCDQYWPDSTREPVFFGDLIVEIESESSMNDYILRVFSMKLGNKVRRAKQFHFLKWPDMGCPDTTWLILKFSQTVRLYGPKMNPGPMVVHCSAGVGRTGTFIAVDHLMQHVRTHDYLDIYNLVMTMRNNRTNMVQTEDQYIFIHDCIKDYIEELEREDEDAEDGDVTDEPDYANAPVYANY